MVRFSEEGAPAQVNALKRRANDGYRHGGPDRFRQGPCRRMGDLPYARRRQKNSGGIAAEPDGAACGMPCVEDAVKPAGSPHALKRRTHHVRAFAAADRRGQEGRAELFGFMKPGAGGEGLLQH